MADKETLTKAKALLTAEQSEALSKLVKKVVITHWLSTMAGALGDGGAKDWALVDFVDTGYLGGGHCTCGNAIRYEYHLENVKDGERIVVGSTCITTHTSITAETVAAVKKGVDEVTGFRDAVAELVVKHGGWNGWAAENVGLLTKFAEVYGKGLFYHDRDERLVRWLVERSLPVPQYLAERVEAVHKHSLPEWLKKNAPQHPNAPVGAKVIVASSDWGKCSRPGCKAPDIKAGQQIYKKDGKWHHLECPAVQQAPAAATAPKPEAPKPQPKAAALEMPTWLAHEKTCAAYMEGYVDAESAKAVHFVGHCVVKATTHCLCCKKELTHDVSKLIGYGPTCAEKLLANHPGYSHKFTMDELETLKTMLQAVKVDAWFPKSKVAVKYL